jgi:hypothetical protein
VWLTNVNRCPAAAFPVPPAAAAFRVVAGVSVIQAQVPALDDLRERWRHERQLLQSPA